MKSYQQELFNHMLDEHNLILTISEMQQIEIIVNNQH